MNPEIQYSSISRFINDAARVLEDEDVTSALNMVENAIQLSDGGIFYSQPELSRVCEQLKSCLMDTQYIIQSAYSMTKTTRNSPINDSDLHAEPAGCAVNVSVRYKRPLKTEQQILSREPRRCWMAWKIY